MKRFVTALQVGFAAFALAMSGGGAAESPTDSYTSADHAEVPMADAMMGAYFMRDTLVPREDDLALIQRKPALYLSSFNDGMATVAYSLEGRRIVYRVVSGTVDSAARDAIDRALAKLQRKVA